MRNVWLDVHPVEPEGVLVDDAVDAAVIGLLRHLRLPVGASVANPFQHEHHLDQRGVINGELFSGGKQVVHALGLVGHVRTNARGKVVASSQSESTFVSTLGMTASSMVPRRRAPPSRHRPRARCPRAVLLSLGLQTLAQCADVVGRVDHEVVAFDPHRDLLPHAQPERAARFGRQSDLTLRRDRGVRGAHVGKVAQVL